MVACTISLMLLRQLSARSRRRAIELVDRLGQRDRVSRIHGRLSPSSTVRRDHRDIELMRALVAVAIGGQGLGVDVGANVGTFARFLFQAAPDQPHILVEPVEFLADSLRARFPRAEVHQVVCGDSSTIVDFSVSIDRPTRSSVHPEFAASGGRIETKQVDQVVLDDLLLDRVPSLVKIDVEGAELAVIRGLRRTLATNRPLLIFEHSGDLAGRRSASGLIHSELVECGYRIFDIDGRGPMDERTFVDVAQSGKMWTFVGVPSHATAS